ncbi:testis-specific gene 13 protein isoform X1 [Cricetulus griseus]|uniref:Testis specific gene A13 n=1 Tax=Cricetulus griseus TaxID=10029 RepID=A0A8C2QI67_CRIGR|nr:testis-specific gene 13 protein isoform X1 [Cricetulus griseus]XP_027250927.1 testis-specific gene 13 protein isoform X1 [Cricetulus griseus]XP_035306568.1 testis-specific gene 13 protein isoform X1 [Cricetulus griseus]
MGPKKQTKFLDDRTSKTMENVSVKFEKKTDPDDELFDTTGPSKFVLKNLRYYTTHPNMAKYYEPLKPSKLQRFLTQRKKMNSFMIKVAEYDQDMTLLLMTNNPPPCSVSLQEDDGSPKYFPPDFQFKETQLQPKPTKNFFLPTMPQKKKLRPDLKTVFPMKWIGDPPSKGQQWFRFSTDNDFKTEGKYSEVYALRKQRKMYPNLIFAPASQREAKKDVSKKSEDATPTSSMLLEPLTFLKLLEEKPTRTVPGENVFRYGRAQQWVIQNATVIK